MDISVPKYDIVFTNDQFTSLLFRERGIQIDHPELINREILSATEVRSRIANDKNWKELVSTTTANIIREIKGIERIKTINKLKTDHH